MSRRCFVCDCVVTVRCSVPIFAESEEAAEAIFDAMSAKEISKDYPKDYDFIHSEWHEEQVEEDDSP